MEQEEGGGARRRARQTTQMVATKLFASPNACRMREWKALLVIPGMSSTGRW
jgi:hypothetical protein